LSNITLTSGLNSGEYYKITRDNMMVPMVSIFDFVK
jgi:hypothetical protein